MLLEILFLLVGVGGLWIGTQLVISGAVNTAKHFKVSETFIGLTILAVGTDLPELFVSVAGAFERLGGTETSGIIVGDIIGSCFGQIGLVLGIVGLFGGLSLTKREFLRDGMMMLGSVILVFLVSLNGTISTLEGIMLIVIYGLYFWNLQREERIEGDVERAPRMYVLWNIVSLIAGLFVVVYGAELVINNGVLISGMLGVSQTMIGIIVIGLGTSLPELILSAGALAKGKTKLSVGNLIGSNIFDALLALGAGSAISGLVVNQNLLAFDIPFLFFLSAVVVFFFRKDRMIKKREAVTLVLLYLVYIGFKFMGL